MNDLKSDLKALDGSVIVVQSTRYKGRYIDAHHTKTVKVTGCRRSQLLDAVWSKFVVHYVRDNIICLESLPSPSTVIYPQEPKNLFWVTPGPADRILRKNAKKITIHLCYCSLYGECWLASGGKDTPPYQACCNPPDVKFQPHTPSY